MNISRARAAAVTLALTGVLATAGCVAAPVPTPAPSTSATVQATISALQGLEPGTVLDAAEAAEAEAVDGYRAYVADDGRTLLIVDDQPAPAEAVASEARLYAASVKPAEDPTGLYGQLTAQFAELAAARLGRDAVIVAPIVEGKKTTGWFAVGAPGHDSPLIFPARTRTATIQAVQALIDGTDDPNGHALIVRP